jgi:hypothetical protein
MLLTIAPKIFAGSFTYYKDGSNRPPVHQDPYVYDLNGDGVDEVIFGGLETQPNTPAEFSPLTVHIFGWKNGVFQNLSDQWLPNGAGDIYGVGSFEFGDFNGDGLTDIFLSAYADMDYVFSPYLLLNRDGFFTKQALPETLAWQHGSSTADLNADGYADVFATGYGSSPTLYLGGPAGLTPYLFTNFAGGSSVALGDFLGDGTTTAVITDFWQSGSDTMLARVRLSQGSKSATLEELGLLPAPLLENLNTTKEESHDARVEAVNFNADGLLDVVVYSRLGFDGSQWPVVSAVQLLQNQGKGMFVDVTADKLKGYVSASMIPYAPVIRDLNRDGLIDIYVDGATWNTVHNSASMLMQNSAGQFVDTARVDLSRQGATNGGVSTVAKGPDSNFYLVTQDIQGGRGFISSQLLTFPDRQASEKLQGTPLPDQIWGEGGNDTLTGGAGNDSLDGGAGVDTVAYSGSKSNYTLTKGASTYTVTDRTGVDGTDTLTNIERLQFSDRTVALDISGTAGQAYRVYQAAFNRTPDNGGLKYWIGLMDGGYTLAGVASGFIASAEFKTLYGSNPTNELFVSKLYDNVLHRAPDTGGYNYWVGLLNTKKIDNISALINFSESPENQAGVIGVIQNGIDLLN